MHQHREHQHRGDAEHHQQLAERLPLRLVLPADLVGVADRQLQLPRAVDRISATALPRSRPSRRAVTSAMPRRFSRSSSRLAVGPRRRAPGSTPARACRRCVRSSVCGSCDGIEADRVRQPHPHRHAAIEQAQVGAAPRRATPPTAAARPARRSGRRGPRPTGSTFHVTSGLPRCMPTTSTTPSILPSISSTGSAICSSTLRIVAEDLDFDRRRAAFEIAEHVLQQLHELDLGERRRLLQLRPQVAR